MELPRAVFFDLDNTLAESFTTPSNEMFQKLTELLPRTPVAVVSAANFDRLSTVIIEHLPSEHFHNLYLFPLNGTAGYQHANDSWNQEYYQELLPVDRSLIRVAVIEALEATGIADPAQAKGELFIDRGTMIAFTALGFDAPKEEKVAWDPDRLKRQLLFDYLLGHHPELFERVDVAFGGRTGLDFTRKGVNKAYAVNWLARNLNSMPSDMLFIGDALYEGGNDAVVIQTGIKTHHVQNPQETLEYLNQLLT